MIEPSERSMWSQLAAAATRGPWRVSFNGYSVKSETDEQPIVAAVPGAAGATGGVFSRWLVDAEFMARAREAVPALLTELGAAEDEVRRLEDGLRHMVEQAGGESCAGYLARALREERRAVEAERELEIQARLRNEQNALIIRLENERTAEVAAHARTQEWLDKFQGECAKRDVVILRLCAALKELGLREHVGCSCHAACIRNGPDDPRCDCGVDEHNAKVEAALRGAA